MDAAIECISSSDSTVRLRLVIAASPRAFCAAFRILFHWSDSFNAAPGLLSWGTYDATERRGGRGPM